METKHAAAAAERKADKQWPPNAGKLIAASERRVAEPDPAPTAQQRATYVERQWDNVLRWASAPRQAAASAWDGHRVYLDPRFFGDGDVASWSEALTGKGYAVSIANDIMDITAPTPELE